MPKTTPQRITVSTLLLIIIGLIDLNMNLEINTATLYLIPIIIFSYQNKLKLYYSALFCVPTLLIWGYVDYIKHPYSNQDYVMINWTTRIAIFVAGFIVSNRFYIEKKQREIIAVQNEALEKTNAELNKFIGIAAHDIRNPVGSISMMADLLLEDEDIPKDKKEYLHMISSTAQTALQILNDTLNLSKIQSGVIQLNLSTNEYIKFVKECLFLNNYLAVKKKQGLDLETAIESVDIVFDKTRLSQVINNLLTNAIKYSEPGTNIVVRISYSEEDYSSILTEVIDQGPGIDEQYQDTIFIPFVTTSNKTTNKESKTGLGLAIAKRIVEAHKGSIAFTSKKEEGSVVFFCLPIT